MKWIFNRNGIEEEVEPRTWVWGVVYDNDTELKQYEEDGTFHQFQEIDQDRVRLFVIYKLDDPTKRFDLVKTEGMKLFCFYLKTKPSYLPDFVTTTVFGYEKNKQKHFIFILNDDRVVVSDIENIDLPNFELKAD